MLGEVAGKGALADTLDYHTGVEYACELCNPEDRTVEKKTKARRPLEQLRTEYAQAASDAAAASADIALYEAKAGKARAKYEEAKVRRDALKRQIAEHPEA